MSDESHTANGNEQLLKLIEEQRQENDPNPEDPKRRQEKGNTGPDEEAGFGQGA
jgi:hypothetical protein